AEWVKDFTLADTQLRSWLFTEEIKKRGGEVWALKSVSGLTNHFKIKLNGKTVQFAGLPLAEFANKYSDKLVNDKILA
ncbi:hypothetical protein H6A18_11350, partial [Collinsella tanakaei]|uniref:hypothetical protein n=1 Tax=Collinsella tanakaei TaxID=626935 RepID=UPI00195DAFAD